MNIQSVENQSLRYSPINGSCGILLMKPPFFTPWTPPLGISIIKTYLEQQGYTVQCYDYNTDSLLWSTHHKYFTALQAMEDVSINDGYSKLWWVLNAHMLAYANGGNSSACSSVIEGVIPFYNIRYDHNVVKTLLEIVRRYFHRLGELTDQIDLSKFAAVGVSAYTTSLASSLFILKKIKQKFPQIMTVMGGGIFADDLALGSDNLNTLIEEYDYIDHVILGEGEKLLLKLLQGELANKRVISIGDIEGKTLEMKDVPSPDFSDLKAENYYHLTIEGARSCPFQCSFCSETIQWGNYRKKPIDLFVGQVVDLARRYNNNAFFLGDSLMNPYIVQFSNALIKTGANILYDGYLRADKPVANQEWVKTWAKSGLYRTRLGIESASARVLKGMDKMTTPATISKALKTLSGAGIRTTTYWIVGFPGETEEDFQETLDFISEHHRFIYELEAHPFNYTPYGQVGSRLYQAYSLYPDTVTDIIRFKAWDVVGVSPTREERYDRLTRISKLASELGIPNIYSMTDRYQAEERWYRLHPLAREIYQGTMKRRSENVPDNAIANTVDWAINPSELSLMEPSRLLAYRISVTGKLEIDALCEAAPWLIRYHDILQTHAIDKVLSDESQGQLGKNVLTIVDLTTNPADMRDQLMANILSDVVGRMSDQTDHLLRIMLFYKEIDVSEVFILARRRAVDTRGLVILSEEFFRIYKQLANQTEISLPDTPKIRINYYIGSGVGRDNSAEWQDGPGDRSRIGKSHNISSLLSSEPVGHVLEDVATGEIFSNLIHEFGLSPAEILLAAILRTVPFAQSERRLMINIDYRPADPALNNTVGALTGICLVPQQVAEERNLISFARSIRKVIEARTANNSSDTENMSALNGSTVLIDMEYVVGAPWLGGEWAGEGFLLDNNHLLSDHICVITPLLTKRGIEVIVNCRDQADNVGDAISRRLATNLKACLNECREYVMGRRFWLKEFSEPPRAALETSPDKVGSELPGHIVERYQVNQDLLNCLDQECVAPQSILTLSAFTVVLSRLNGSENISILIVMYDNGNYNLLPIKLYPSWKTSFRQYAREVARKVEEANRYSAVGAELLERSGHNSEEDRSPLALDVACVLSQGGEVYGLSIEEILKMRPELHKNIGLALIVDVYDGRTNIAYDYQPRTFAKKRLDKLSEFITVLLESVKMHPDMRIGDIPLESKAEAITPAEAFVNDVFNF